MSFSEEFLAFRPDKLYEYGPEEIEADIKIKADIKKAMFSKPKGWSVGYTGKYNDDYSGDAITRYILRTSGENPIVCIGVNPSTADDNKLDPTMIEVLDYADKEGYSGIIMLNLYPLRSPKPDNLPLTADEQLIAQNLDRIKEVLEKLAAKYGQITVWAAWGDSFDKRRNYFDKCFCEIINITDRFNCVWKTAGLTGQNNPRHPLYLARMRNENKPRPEFVEFNVKWYIKTKRINSAL